MKIYTSRYGVIPTSRLVGLLIGAFALFTCSSPLSRSGADDSQSGHLSIEIPAVAAWLKDSKAESALNGEIPGQASKDISKALAYSNKYKVEVQNSSGQAVISPVTGPIFNTLYSGISISSISVPVGSGYTVKLSIYNTAVSSDTPTVSGQATGVSVTRGTNTSVTITCLPVSPSALTLDVPANASFAKYAEKWYSLSVVSGTHFYLTEADANVKMGLFNASGTYISSSYGYIDYAATYSGTLYVGVAANSSATSVLTVSTAVPILNEGSLSSPIALTLNSAHAFKAGPYGTQDTSYYRFTTTNAGTYSLDTALGYYYATLYSDPGFSSVMVGSTFTNYGLVFNALSASTTYYLKIMNIDSSPMSISGQIVDSTTISGNTDSEGSVATPIPLAVDTAWSGKVGAHSYNKTSYYKIFTGSGIDYTISLSSIAPSSSGAVYVYIYSDASFSSQLGYFYAGSSGGSSIDIVMASSTTYYLKVSNSPSNGAISYSLKAAALAISSFISLPADGSWTSGTTSSSSSYVWFVATVIGGKSYLLNWDDSYQGSGSYTLDIKVSAYQADRATAYFTNKDSGYSSSNTQTITVPLGQSQIYVLVQPYSAGYSGTFALKLTQRPPSGGMTVTVD